MRWLDGTNSVDMSSTESTVCSVSTACNSWTRPSAPAHPEDAAAAVVAGSARQMRSKVPTLTARSADALRQEPPSRVDGTASTSAVYATIKRKILAQA